MKSLTRRILVSLVLSAVTLFTTPSIYASCMFTLADEFGPVGFCSCGSSAGPYCATFGGGDLGVESGLMGALCGFMCPGVPLQTRNINDPSRPVLFEYPRSHQLARANLIELRRLKNVAGATPVCGNVTIYDLVLQKRS